MLHQCKELLAKLSIDPQAETNYTLNHGILRYKGKIVVGDSSELRISIITNFHSTALGGHSREHATYKRIKLLFHWVGLKRDVIKFVKECATCQKNKSEHTPYPGLLKQMKVPEQAWTHINMDFIEGLPTSNGKNVILVVVDSFTKYSHFISLSHPYSVKQVAQLCLDNVYKLHGFPSVIVSDRGIIFTSALWQEMLKAGNIKMNMSTSYHPQTDGQTERVNQCLENYLRCMAFETPKKWSQYLPIAEWWYNTSYHRDNTSWSRQ
jgi:transposase InsO family protein